MLIALNLQDSFVIYIIAQSLIFSIEFMIFYYYYDEIVKSDRSCDFSITDIVDATVTIDVLYTPFCRNLMNKI